MSTFPGSPKLLKGGLVVLAPGGSRARRVISLQYNPDTLSRSYQVQGVGGEGGGERAQPFRFKGPAIESIKLDAEIDATDQLEFPDRNPVAAEFGIAPQIAALEALVNPSNARICWRSTPMRAAARSRSCRRKRRWCSSSGAAAAWCRCASPSSRSPRRPSIRRSIPIRAKVSLGLRVLTVDDLGYAHRGGTLFLTYLRTREALARARAGRDACSRSASPTCREAKRMNDPVQLLIDAGAIPASPFGPTSRYANVAIASLPGARRGDQRRRTCCAASCRRRATSRLAARHMVRAGDRVRLARGALPRRRASSTGASPTPTRRPTRSSSPPRRARASPFRCRRDGRSLRTAC